MYFIGFNRWPEVNRKAEAMSDNKESANLMDLYMEDVPKPAELYTSIPRKYLHSDSRLDKVAYTWSGELPAEELKEDDVIVTLDAWAYRQRRGDGVIVRLRTGGFTQGKDFYTLKLMGCIRDGSLYVVTEKANKKVSDIAPKTPVRVAGIGSAMKRFHKQTAA